MRETTGPGLDAAELFKKATRTADRKQDSLQRLAVIRARAAAAMLLSGRSNQSIAKELGISVGRVSQLIGANDPDILMLLGAWQQVEQGLRSALPEDLRETANLTHVVQHSSLPVGVREEVVALATLRNSVLHGGEISPLEAVIASESARRVNAMLDLGTDEAEATNMNMAHGAEESAVTCFVIGPIGNRHAGRGTPDRARYEQALRVWENIISPACEALGIEPIRADKMTRVGEITDQIFRMLRDADVVIADLTSGNPNVMYELGLRHTTSKLTIHLAEAARLPFDVHAIRTIQFSPSELGYIEAREELTKILRTGLTQGFDVASATRIWTEARSAQSLDSVLDDDAEEDHPGFIDLMSDGEAALEEVSGVLEKARKGIELIGELATKATDQIDQSDSRGAGMRGRLTIAKRLSEQMKGPADELHHAADEYAQVIRRADAGLDVMIRQLEDDPSQLAEVGEFPDSIVQLAEANREAMGGAGQLARSLSGAASLSRDLRGPATKIERAIQRIINGSSPIETWSRRITQIRASMSRSPIFDRLFSEALRANVGVLAGLTFELHPERSDPFTDEELDQIEAWLTTLNPSSDEVRGNPLLVRREEKTTDRRLLWSGEVQLPGPVVQLLSAQEPVPAEEAGNAVSLSSLFGFWTTTAKALQSELRAITFDRVRWGVTLPPYPGGEAPVVDLAFSDLPAPVRSGPPRNVTPWSLLGGPLPVTSLAVDMPIKAAESLLRHYGYRHVDETLMALRRREEPSLGPLTGGATH